MSINGIGNPAMIAVPIDIYGNLSSSSRSFFSITISVRIGKENITSENWLEGIFSFIWSCRLDISPTCGFSEEIRNNSAVAKALLVDIESLFF
jgi:hypothetical protein